MPVLRRLHSCSIVCCLAIRHPTQEEPHVGRPPPSVRSRGARRSARDAARSARGRRRRRPRGRIRPQSRPGSRRHAGVVAFAGRRNRDARLIRRERRDPGLARGHEALHARSSESTSRPTPSPTARSRSTSTTTCRAARQDVFTWFAGYRMQFFAAKGLATPIDDVWETADAADAAGLQGRLDRL